MTKKIKSTYDKLMESMTPNEKKEYEKELKDLIISELVLAAMEEDNISVRKLAKLAGVSPTVVQDMRSGLKKSFNTDTLFKIIKELGYSVLLERDGHITRLDIPHLGKK
jgi:hypothetical protein